MHPGGDDWLTVASGCLRFPHRISPLRSMLAANSTQCGNATAADRRGPERARDQCSDGGRPLEGEPFRPSPRPVCKGQFTPPGGPRVGRRVVLTAAVSRMIRVGGPAIDPAFGMEPAALNGAFGLVVTMFAEALQPAERELVPISAMRLDVVSHGCGRHQAALATKPAQGLDLELVPGAAFPGGQAIPAIGGNGVRIDSAARRFGGSVGRGPRCHGRARGRSQPRRRFHSREIALRTAPQPNRDIHRRFLGPLTSACLFRRGPWMEAP